MITQEMMDTVTVEKGKIMTNAEKFVHSVKPTHTTPSNTLRVLDVNGLEEEIRCAMCENPMCTDRGCDGGCEYDERLYDTIIKVLNGRIKELPSVQSDVPDTNVGDLISRQDAIETALTFFVEYLGGAFHEGEQVILKERMEQLPSVQPVTDCISRQQAIDLIESFYKIDKSVLNIMAFNLKQLPSVHPQKGKWIFIHPLQADDEGAYICSNCHHGDWDIKPTDKYCKFCMADMREGDAE